MRQRVRQFFRAMLARVSPSERAIVEGTLSPEQAALFWRMAPSDQRHGLDVYYALRDGDCQDDALLVAARSGSARSPSGWLARWAGERKGWKAPFATHLQHPQIGAAWAQAAGSSADIVTLIRQHHASAPRDERLIALQEADKGN